MQTAPYSALDVAAYIIQKANSVRGKKKDLTPLKLQKILYYAQGWHLARKGAPLFKSRIVAWQHGPVIKEVYDAYKNRLVVSHIRPQESVGNVTCLDTDAKEFLDEIWDNYGGKSAWELVGMTHLTQPWIDARNDPLSQEITEGEMRKYFTAIAPAS